MAIRAIITGATGMIGEGVMYTCLNHDKVESIIAITRKPSGYNHEKLTEIIHSDFGNIESIKNQLRDSNAVFFCAGVSSVGKNEAEYKKATYDLTLNFAHTLLEISPEINFCYISGAGTDSTEKGRTMWARVKGKTENDLLALGFDSAYMFRPGYIQPIKGLKYTLPMYRYISFLYPLLKSFMGKYVVTLEELALAMINSNLSGYEKKILECSDIVNLARREN
jgi:uncharacterized protein YbjT (DUF2867 family)